jgi:exodeoxyribonuclease-3
LPALSDGKPDSTFPESAPVFLLALSDGKPDSTFPESAQARRARIIMQFKITTWNINSVRLRIDLLARFIKAARPDILCLQETKCPDDAFPFKRFERLGYVHAAIKGQKGYHGVAILSRLPFESIKVESFCGKTDSRHIAVTLGERAGLRDPVIVHNFYVPAGGDEPDPAINEKFAHKLAFLDEMRERPAFKPGAKERMILVGDLNVAPLEHDVWSHKQLLDVVSHTPIECEKLLALQKAGGWADAMRRFIPEPAKLYTWWSYRAPDWAAADKGRRLDHIWTSPALADRLGGIAIARQTRGWPRPSDHVPATVTIEL